MISGLLKRKKFWQSNTNDLEPLMSNGLIDRSRLTYSGIAILPSNTQAIESSIAFAGGVNPFLAIIGPSGWGKSSIIHSTALQLYRETGAQAKVISAMDWIMMPPNASRITGPLIVDDVQEILGKAQTRNPFKAVLEKRMIDRLPTMLSFTGHKVTHAIKGLLPFFKDWDTVVIQQPSTYEKELVIRHMVISNGMSVSHEILHLLSRKIRGNGRTVYGALQRLKLMQDIWLDSSATLRGFGLLYPCLSDRFGWDLRDFIYEVINKSWKINKHPLVKEIQKEDLCIYIMTKCVCLSEIDVASFFKKDPGEIYLTSNKIGERYAESEFRELLNYCIVAILNSVSKIR